MSSPNRGNPTATHTGSNTKMLLATMFLAAACFPTSLAATMQQEPQLRQNGRSGNTQTVHYPKKRGLIRRTLRESGGATAMEAAAAAGQRQSLTTSSTVQDRQKAQSPTARRRRNQWNKSRRDLQTEDTITISDNIELSPQIGAFDHEDDESTSEQQPSIYFDFEDEMNQLFEEHEENEEATTRVGNPVGPLLAVNTSSYAMSVDIELSSSSSNSTNSSSHATTVNNNGEEDLSLTVSGDVVLQAETTLPAPSVEPTPAPTPRPTQEQTIPPAGPGWTIVPNVINTTPAEQDGDETIITTIATPTTTTPPVVVSAQERDDETTAAPGTAAAQLAAEAGNTIVLGVTENLDQGASTTTNDGDSSTTISVTEVTTTTTTTTTTVSSAQEGPTPILSTAVKGVNSSKKAKSKEGAFGVAGAKEKKTKKVKGIKNSRDGISGVAGKGGKGGTSSKSGSKYASSSGSSSTGASGTSGTSGSGTVIVSAPAPTPVVSSAVEVPQTLSPAQQAMEIMDRIEVDCDAIASGTANTNTPKQQSFSVQANWILEDSASFATVAAGVQQYLQSEVAPAIAGCDNNRRKQRRHLQDSRQWLEPEALITGVVFETPTSDGNCATDQDDVACYTTEGATKMYYYGSDEGVGDRLLSYLQAAGTYPVDGLLGVANLDVYDASGNLVGRASGNGGSSSTPSPTTNGNEDSDMGGTAGQGGIGGQGDDSNGQGAVSNGQGTVSNSEGNGSSSGQGNEDASNNSGGQTNNVAGATGQEKSEGEDEGLSQWSKILIGALSATAFLGCIICVVIYCMYRRRDNQVYHADLDSEHDHAIPDEVTKVAGSSNVFMEDASGFAATWPPPGGDDGSSSSEEEMGRDAETAEIVMNTAGGQTQVENQQGVHFISSDQIEMEHQEELPDDAIRDYYVNDTVAL